jgi:hypothetical protein
MRKDWKAYLLGAGALALGLVSFSAAAHCDKITGGGWIITEGYPLFPPGSHPPAKGTFGAGGGCKHGQPWGHLEYHDHGNGLNVHWLTITGYQVFPGTTDDGAENDPKREGSRLICGTARTNLYEDVDFAMEMADRGEPGVDDVFRLRLTKPVIGIVYSTECDADHTLGGTGSGGGNIQLHKPNPSTDAFAPFSCPAFAFARPACAR